MSIMSDAEVCRLLRWVEDTRAFVRLASSFPDDFESMRIARVVNEHVEKTLSELRAHHAARVDAWALSKAAALPCPMAPEARAAQGCAARAA